MSIRQSRCWCTGVAIGIIGTGAGTIVTGTVIMGGTTTAGIGTTGIIGTIATGEVDRSGLRF
jgi:hypothetical protein